MQPVSVFSGVCQSFASRHKPNTRQLKKILPLNIETSQHNTCLEGNIFCKLRNFTESHTDLNYKHIMFSVLHLVKVKLLPLGKCLLFRINSHGSKLFTRFQMGNN